MLYNRDFGSENLKKDCSCLCVLTHKKGTPGNLFNNLININRVLVSDIILRIAVDKSRNYIK